MKINCLLEGGVGDLMLATRFIAAAREAHPGAHVSCFVNNDNNDRFNSFLNKHWGHLWDEFFPDVARISNHHQIHSQFGNEVYNAAISNITPEWIEKLNNADRVYNFHLDSLDFTQYDIPWKKYMRHLPRPVNDTKLSESTPDSFIAVNLFARPGHFSAISKEQSDLIIDGLREIRDVRILAPSEEVKNSFYERHKDVTVVTDLSESLKYAEQSEMGVSIDSGLRCMFYPFDKACYTLCKLVEKPFEVRPSHTLRWYMWPEQMLPVDVKPAYLSALVENGLNNPAALLYPQLPSAIIDQVLVRRQYA